MNLEIERKWIVDSKELQMSSNQDPANHRIENRTQIQQGYFETANPDMVFRVRVNQTDNIGYMTLKSHIEPGVAEEFEYEIPYKDAVQLFNTSDYKLEKERIVIDYKNQLFEVDYYSGSNMVTAELELKSKNKKIDLPEWCKQEVTGNKEYSNYNIAKNLK